MADRWEMLTALSDPTRQAVLNLLRHRAASVGDLAQRLPVSRPAVSQHLQVLKSVGLVEEERQGTRHYFRLNPKSLAELRAHIDEMWEDALAAFSHHVKEKNVPTKTRKRYRSKKRQS